MRIDLRGYWTRWWNEVGVRGTRDEESLVWFKERLSGRSHTVRTVNGYKGGKGTINRRLDMIRGEYRGLHCLRRVQRVRRGSEVWRTMLTQMLFQEAYVSSKCQLSSKQRN